MNLVAVEPVIGGQDLILQAPRVDGGKRETKKERFVCNLSCRAGVQGFEPQLTDPESAVLPLNDTPMTLFDEGSIAS